jgi:hypothetical protein
LKVEILKFKMEEDKNKNNASNEENSTKLPNEAETGPT